MCVCVLALVSLGNAHIFCAALYCPIWLYCIFARYLINDTIFGESLLIIGCVLWFYMQLYIQSGGVLGNFKATYSFFLHSVPLGSTQPLTEMSTTEFPWGLKTAGAYSWQLFRSSWAECQGKDGSQTFQPWLVTGVLHVYSVFVWDIS